MNKSKNFFKKSFSIHLYFIIGHHKSIIPSPPLHIYLFCMCESCVSFYQVLPTQPQRSYSDHQVRDLCLQTELSPWPFSLFQKSFKTKTRQFPVLPMAPKTDQGVSPPKFTLRNQRLCGLLTEQWMGTRGRSMVALK